MNELLQELKNKTEITLKNYLAKTHPKKTLEEHTEEVLKVFFNFIKEYPQAFSKEFQEMILISCYYHDFGKSSILFQNEIKGINQNDNINHGMLSPKFLPKEYLIDKYGLNEYQIIATAIFYHHKRITDIDGTKYREIFEKYVKPVIPNINPNIKRFKLKDLLFDKRGTDLPEEDWEKYSKVKGMLNRFDYAASSGTTIAELKNKNKLIAQNIEQDFTLNDIQTFAKENKNKNIIIVASTGIGKTEASLLWLNNSKGFYTLPLKVASNDIYKRCKNYGKNNDIALLHSDSFGEMLKNNSDLTYSEYCEMKRLSYPLTICTVDQIFKFPFKALGEEQFVATLSYSKVIVDEIQMYSPVILACIIIGLKTVNEYGGHFAITTATLPTFLEDKIKEYIGENNYIKKISVSNKTRHFIEIVDGDFNYDKIIKDSESSKVLIICNTVKKAIEIYKILENKVEELHLLHARFIKKDREKLETEIKNFNKNGIWITTKIVEASLDISFDILHTEISPADSLMQRLGRCNRKGLIIPDKPNVFVYNTERKRIYDKNLVNLSLEKLEKYNKKLISEEEKLEYINSVYNKEELKRNDTNYIEELNKAIHHLEKVYPLKYNQSELQKLFRDINTITIIPDSIYVENHDEIERLINESNDKLISFEKRYQSKQKLLEYTTTIYYNPTKIYSLINGASDIYRVYGNYSSKYGFEIGEENESGFI